MKDDVKFKKGQIPWNKGMKMCEAHKQKLSESHKGQIPWNKGTAKPYIKKGHSRYWLGKKRSIEDRKKMSIAKIGKSYPKQIKSRIGLKFSEEHKKKISIAHIKHMKKVGRTYLQPNIGLFEKRILDALEKNLGYKLIRQQPISSFFVDGYCKELNLVIEINEEYHHKNKKNYDVRRQKEIEKITNCIFLNINIPNEVNLGCV